MRAKERFLKEEAEKSFHLEVKAEEMVKHLKEEYRVKSDLENDLVRTNMKLDIMCS